MSSNSDTPNEDRVYTPLVRFNRIGSRVHATTPIDQQSHFHAADLAEARARKQVHKPLYTYDKYASRKVKQNQNPKPEAQTQECLCQYPETCPSEHRSPVPGAVDRQTP